MSVTPPLSNAVNVQVTDGTNAMPTGDTALRALWMNLAASGNALTPVPTAPTADGRGQGIGFGLETYAEMLTFNGTTWDRQRNNQASTPIATVAAAKATQTSADQVNYNGK